MLTSLRIDNFAIVKHLELDFAQGMTAFTGETGAGKSIMIDALMLALGGRADASVIRSGEQKCDINASFSLDVDSEPCLWLQEHDITCEQGEIILRRALYLEGRSKSYINGQPFPLQKIKELSEMLVHIHGQHQHQTLMHHATHRSQVDNYAGHHELLANVQEQYKACQKIKNELDALKNQGNKHHDRLELLQFQIDELNAMKLQEGEMKQLNEEHHCLHNANDYQLCAQEVMHALSNEDESSICRSINRVLQRLSELPGENPAINNARELLNSTLIHCEEALNEVQTFANAVQLDPERLQAVETRLSTLHQVARKHHVEASHLPEHARLLQEELLQLQQSDRRATLLTAQYIEHVRAYEQAALQLTESRLHYAEKLAAEISAIIRQLGMPKGYVIIELSPLEKMQAHGLDKVEYKVCTNPGMAPDLLSKIASGGELSRISLAIQMITAQRGATPTLLFDEVDVGIGGATAALVGQLLRNLGERLQVFCVTHQAQVASSAHHHFVVEKQSDHEHTYSRIIALSETDKIDEIARMLGGLTITEQTRSHAKELLTQSH